MKVKVESTAPATKNENEDEENNFERRKKSSIFFGIW